jgi:hypothetical protein
MHQMSAPANVPQETPDIAWDARKSEYRKLQLVRRFHPMAVCELNRHIVDVAKAL